MSAPRTFPVTGLVRHRFHGDYWCTVVLSVEQPRLLAQLEHHLDAQGGGLPYSRTTAAGALLVGPLGSEGLERMADWLEPLRTDDPCRLFDCRHTPAGRRHDIGSTAHSIDHGPLFRVELPCVDLLTPTLPFKES